MSLTGRLFCSSIGRKFLMAVTGIILIFFIVGHLVGNLQIFQHPDHINGYAYFLRQLGPMLWIVRLVLLVSVVLHIWAATALALENRAARGQQPYGVKTWIQASFASRYVRWTGYIVLAFILYHLAQFTFGYAQSASFKENLPLYTMTGDYHVMGFPVVKAGTQVPDVHSMVILGFQSPVVSIFYIIAVGLLSFHLLHGMDSLFQTFGWRSATWAGSLRKTVTVLCLLYFLGNLIIPGSVLIGAKGLREGFQPAVARAGSH
ncbi:MAG TPA: succinate dehydrogenase cytochrome b subunit [Opitutaceae bacterium]|nr:succinate dehydrogenase cytochrome b subunit [Opitutaceae bacterium]